MSASRLLSAVVLLALMPQQINSQGIHGFVCLYNI